MKYLQLISLLLLVLFVGCRKEFETTQVTENPHTPIVLESYNPTIENIVSTVAGMVVDEMGEPVEDALVTLGNLQKSTDAFGAFYFENTTMNQKGTFVQIEKAGYFLGGRRFYPRANQASQIRIELLEKTFSESFEASNGATVNILGDGGTITFEPNSIRNSSGAIYNGVVKIATKWLSPTGTNTADQMPGALEGVDTNNEEVGLTTYGMVGVELEGSAGEKLNIADGFTAELSMNVPAELQAAAPSEIPLWSFNYEYGIWVEEGSATLQNGKYVGEVSHFSFWNCDVPGKFVEFELRVVAEGSGNPIADVKVLMTRVDGSSSGSGYTNAEGFVSGLLPASSQFLLRILAPSVCGDELYSATVGPFTTDEIFDDIEISSIGFKTYVGSVLNCDNEPVTNGAVLLNMNGNYSTHLISGNPFGFTVYDCSNGGTIEIAGVDLEGGTQGTFTTAASNGQVGSLVACGELLTGFIKITVDGTTEIYPIDIKQVPDTLEPFLTQLQFYNASPIDTGTVYLGLTNPTNPPVWFPGDFSERDYIDIIRSTKNGWYIANNNPDFETFVFTEYGIHNNTIVAGYASGNLINEYGGTGTPVFVEIEFRAFRMGN